MNFIIRCLQLESYFYHIKTLFFSNNLNVPMFTESLGNRLLSPSRSMKNILNPEQSKSLDFTDLQFELCANFFKQTKERLYQQQAEMLTFSQQLISTVQQKVALSNFNLKDTSASQDTTMFSNQAADDQDVFSQSSKSMLILRKSRSTNCMRRTQNDYSLILREIQSKCSGRTSQTVTNLIEQNKRLKQKTINIEKKEKQFKKKLSDYEKEQEQIFLLKKKNAEYDKVINSLHGEISALKLRLKQSESLKRSKSPTHDFQFPQIIEIETTLKLFINQKEQVIVESTRKLRELYGEVLKKLEEPFLSEEESCGRCCEMFRRIKGSIMKYRQLMEGEANAVEELYEKFKARLK